jgi:predicted  nucleic acid-binding Zn-ribbon protein
MTYADMTDEQLIRAMNPLSLRNDEYAIELARRFKEKCEEVTKMKEAYVYIQDRSEGIEGSMVKTIHENTSLRSELAKVRGDLSEAYEAIRENYTIVVANVNNMAVDVCQFCLNAEEHAPTCIVLTAQKARDGE